MTFEDYDGTVLKTETVEEGEDATPPIVAERNGYSFVGWSGNYTNITDDTIITATYEAYDVKFTLSSETVTPGEEFEIDLAVCSNDSALVDGLLAYNLSFDTSMLSFVGFSKDSELVTKSQGGINSVSDAAKIINLGYSPAIVANGSISKLKFKVKDTVPAGTQIEVSMQVSASKDRVPLSTIIAPSCVVTVVED